jgi:hypothetical protein
MDVVNPVHLEGFSQDAYGLRTMDQMALRKVYAHLPQPAQHVRVVDKLGDCLKACYTCHVNEATHCSRV